MARIVDDRDWGFGWIGDESPRSQLAGHALLANGRVWLVDPPEPGPVEERIRDLGEPGGVIQLLDRHNRASAALAERLGVPLWVVPVRTVADAPFDFVPLVRNRWWVESALWWPDRRVLVCADALGTVAHYFRLSGAFDEPTVERRTPATHSGDPLYAVWARRRPSDPPE